MAWKRGRRTGGEDRRRNAKAGNPSSAGLPRCYHISLIGPASLRQSIDDIVTASVIAATTEEDHSAAEW